jgi:hypothetical protein
MDSLSSLNLDNLNEIRYLMTGDRLPSGVSDLFVMPILTLVFPQSPNRHVRSAPSTRLSVKLTSHFHLMSKIKTRGTWLFILCTPAVASSLGAEARYLSLHIRVISWGDLRIWETLCM